ncbi:TPA: hypothetical protein HA235_00550 [Candidatus Woesearchaeota archaeon]|nr:hypothetical protein [Candidatus Woesearchaeota archaeon]HIH31173.1 hypothetical protein [Candidatus Woesearchaeota archaeon]HIH55559.1 hypothetical protein [Candidatus Woesearchaeota archaeon]HIJ01818.1 hypothetical protein [Candidatus Woesearchaeota archaeon]HIJ13113.1 hypothetical protein [Candidatus Woesearchaeota archaeon]
MEDIDLELKELTDKISDIENIVDKNSLQLRNNLKNIEEIIKTGNRFLITEQFDKIKLKETLKNIQTSYSDLASLYSNYLMILFMKNITNDEIMCNYMKDPDLMKKPENYTFNDFLKDPLLMSYTTYVALLTQTDPDFEMINN